uniref:N-acetylgalactosamine 4-sulfate 6-O-sulfotransferase n=2 Tax=Tetraselmis sp. GSL018 TaxID=582737 RepID=A0A061RGM4_9CHLO
MGLSLLWLLLTIQHIQVHCAFSSHSQLLARLYRVKHKLQEVDVVDSVAAERQGTQPDERDPELEILASRKESTEAPEAQAASEGVVVSKRDPDGAPAAGHGHGRLFTWGLSGPRSGRSGDATVPGQALQGQGVLSVSGSAHTLALLVTGEVLSMGRNDSEGGGGFGSQPILDSGQLGRKGGEAYAPVPALSGMEIVQVAAGRYHSVALRADGVVFTWGLNDVGQLGRPGTTSKSGVWDGCLSGHNCRSGWPMPVQGPLTDVPVAAVSAGRYWTLAVARDGRLFTWGMDGCATGSLPSTPDLHEPRLVGGALEGTRIVGADSGYTLWLALSDGGDVYSCSTQDDGYAGTLPQKRFANQAGELGRTTKSNSDDGTVPGKVELPAGEKAVSVAAGRQHGLVATASGRVFTWGQGGAVLGRQGNPRLPGALPGFPDADGLPAKLVAAGEYFSLVATESSVYGFGINGYHMGGIGPSTEEIRRPTRVSGPLGNGEYEILDLQAGYQHSMAIVRPREAASAPALPVAQPGPQHRPEPPRSFAWGRRRSGPAQHRRRYSDLLPRAAAPGTAAPASTESATPVTTDPSSYLSGQAKPPTKSVAEQWSAWRWTQRHSAIAGTAPDVFSGLPKEFDPAYRNPCWREGGSLRCIPYFHILGVSKCGTTDLYHRVAKHPELVESANKGPHFWDECQWPPSGACTVPPSGDWQGYIALFDRAASQISLHRDLVTGEASSNTFTASGVYLRGHDPKRNNPEGVTIAELLREAQPYLRLIVIFRNPVDRYFSAFHYYRDRRAAPPSAADFHQRAVSDIAEWESCAEKHGAQACITRFHPQQLIKGMYVEFLDDWVKHFPREQLLFLRNEDYAAATKEHLTAVFSFLGLREPAESEWASINSLPKRNQQEKDGMLPETRAMLEKFYKPFNNRLADALNDNRFTWKE